MKNQVHVVPVEGDTDLVSLVSVSENGEKKTLLTTDRESANERVQRFIANGLVVLVHSRSTRLWMSVANRSEEQTQLQGRFVSQTMLRFIRVQYGGEAKYVSDAMTKDEAVITAVTYARKGESILLQQSEGNSYFDLL